MKIAICDDEKLFIQELENDLNNLNEIEKIDSIQKYTDVDALLFAIEGGQTFDLIFMDIYFPDNKKTGINYAGDICRILHNAQIIFVTSFNEKYSQEIFLEKVNLCGYLVKPINQDILSQLIIKARDNINSEMSECMLIETKQEIQRVPFRKITYLESKGHRVIIHSDYGDFTVYKKLEDVVTSTPEYFLRCHKSYTVNMNEIMAMKGYMLTLRNNINVPISRTRYKNVYESFIGYAEKTI